MKLLKGLGKHEDIEERFKVDRFSTSVRSLLSIKNAVIKRDR